MNIIVDDKSYTRAIKLSQRKWRLAGGTGIKCKHRTNFSAHMLGQGVRRVARKDKLLKCRFFSAYTGESFDELRSRVGEEEFARRLQACQDKAMAAVGYYRDGCEFKTTAMD